MDLWAGRKGFENSEVLILQRQKGISYKGKFLLPLPFGYHS